MRDAPMGFVVAIVNSLAEAPMDFMTQNQATRTSIATSVLTPCGAYEPDFFDEAMSD
jgi:hypothetical protein